MDKSKVLECPRLFEEESLSDLCKAMDKSKVLECPRLFEEESLSDSSYLESRG